MKTSTPTLRLDRLLANMGYGSRKDIQALVKAKRILLDGVPVTDADAHVPVSPALSARLKVAGAPLDPPPGFALMLHKPLGVTCSHKEVGPLVYGLLPPRWRARKPAISTIGRLDKETSGLLLMTDDGGLLHRVIAPKSNVSKRYRVTLARALRGDERTILASGTLMLDGEDKPLLPVAMEIVPDLPKNEPVVFVTLTEGRYHQVRRMFAALGNHVAALHRDRVGGLTLPAELAPGAYQVLGVDAIAQLFHEPSVSK
ncbi:MAG: pseudouridine synthase [Hyphomicrobiaceae bacterium]